MAIAFRNANPFQSTTAATSVTVTPPTGTVVGDALVLVLATDASNSVHSTPSGWTTLSVSGLNQADGVNGHVLSAWTKYASSADASGTTFNVTWTGSNNYACVIAGYSGVDGTTMQDASDVFGSQGAFGASPRTFAYSSITTVTANAWVLVVGTTAPGTGTTNPTLSTTSGMTVRATAKGANVFPAAWIADIAQASAGASGTKSFTMTATSDTFCHTGWTMALRPATAAAFSEEDGYRPPILTQDSNVSVFT